VERYDCKKCPISRAPDGPFHSRRAWVNFTSNGRLWNNQGCAPSLYCQRDAPARPEIAPQRRPNHQPELGRPGEPSRCALRQGYPERRSPDDRDGRKRDRHRVALLGNAAAARPIARSQNAHGLSLRGEPRCAPLDRRRRLGLPRLFGDWISQQASAEMVSADCATCAASAGSGAGAAQELACSRSSRED
jgi:hypothetical protein